MRRVDRMMNQSKTVDDVIQGAAPVAGAGVVAGVGAGTGMRVAPGGVASPVLQGAGNDAGDDPVVSSATADRLGRQLKELRSLMPWNWDARIEDHPPGEKAMMDFEDVVNYRYDGRRRARSVSAVEEVERFKRAEEAKAEREKKRLARLERAAKKEEGRDAVGAGESKAKKDEVQNAVQKAPQNAVQKAATTKTAVKRAARVTKGRVVCGGQRRGDGRARATRNDNNKENVPPVEKAQGGLQADVSTAVTPSAAKGRRNEPRSCTKDHAVTTPGFVLTPAVGNTSSVSARKRGKGDAGSDGDSNSNKHSKRLTGGRPKANKSRRVTFGVSAGAGVQLAPSRSDPKAGGARYKKTPRAVNFPESLTIDLDKYGYGIGMRPPPGCPPLFHTIKDHGRTTVPAMSPMTAVDMPALNDATIPRACTPFRGRPVLSREFVLAQMVQAGMQAAAELEQLAKAKAREGTEGNKDAYATGLAQAGPSLPLEISPELGAALTTLSLMRTNM